MTEREDIAKKLRELGDEMGDIDGCYETAFEEIDAIIQDNKNNNLFY